MSRDKATGRDKDKVAFGRAVMCTRIDVYGVQRARFLTRGTISYAHLYGIENGTANPSADMIAKLAAELHTTVAALHERAEEIKNDPRNWVWNWEDA